MHVWPFMQRSVVPVDSENSRMVLLGAGDGIRTRALLLGKHALCSNSARMLQSRFYSGSVVVSSKACGPHSECLNRFCDSGTPTSTPRLHHTQTTPWPHVPHGCTTHLCSRSMQEETIMASIRK